MTVHIPEPPVPSRPLSERLGVKVVETPLDRLRRLTLAPDGTRDELWEAIAASIININERMAVLEADSEARRQVIASIQRRVSAPLDMSGSNLATPDQPGV